jgi:hypothetical protein
MSKENLHDLTAELKRANFAKFIQEECDDYETTEHELAFGIEVSPEDLEVHELIKAKVQAGCTLRHAMADCFCGMYVKLWEQEHPFAPDVCLDLIRELVPCFRQAADGH